LSNKDKIPGPGQYGKSNQGGMGNQKGGGFSFGKDTRGLNLKGNNVPGPGQYSKQPAKVNFDEFLNISNSLFFCIFSFRNLSNPLKFQFF
jgi:hypothetical protein